MPQEGQSGGEESTVGAPLSNATPAAVGSAAAGSSSSASRADHVHAHGNQAGGGLHPDAVAAGASGFMSGADKTKVDGVAASAAAVGSTTPANVGAAAVGVAATAARSDHVHALPDTGPGAGTIGGSTTALRSVTVDAKGRVTGATAAAAGDFPIASSAMSPVRILASGNHTTAPSTTESVTTFTRQAGERLQIFAFPTDNVNSVDITYGHSAAGSATDIALWIERTANANEFNLRVRNINAGSSRSFDYAIVAV